MDLGLRGKLALVTGGSSGLGFASALELALEGADVILFSRSVERLESARRRIREVASVNVDIYAGDLRVKEDVEGLFKYVESRYGRLDILVYSTGGPKPGGFFDISDDDWEDSFKLLTMSALRVSREAAKLMARGRWGRIVFIGSITLIRPLENLATSNIMRMPIVGLVRTLALELAKYNITVNAILPYDILTERVRQLAEADAKRLGVSFEEALKRRTSKVPLGRMGDPRDLGALVAFLASERASYITGALIPLDGGMHLSY
ncbi:MAG: SDR family oxidoreductase [Desulfurococcales archaeon]|nr:SDR family oxidoreductase [Desulfurococcaceae archaeon]MCC6060825.1 SDR family oxidoreductase [Desulfurococcaceae archaeon]MDT7866443.1 SDR family oxidoreductase [Desulfurococcales archaeon]